MLSKNTFQEQLLLLSVNYGFSIDGSEGKIYKQMVYNTIKDKTTNEIFRARVESYISRIKSSKWNEIFGFKGKPSVADWLESFCAKRQEVTCKPYLEFNVMRCTRFETYEEAILRENKNLKTLEKFTGTFREIEQTN